jgi:putative ABC transport system permease protein
MISPLDLKLVRDMGKMKGQMIAVAIVMACGLAMMIMSRSLILSLESTRDTYYTRNRFADVFSDLKRAPNALRSRLAQIPGVAAVETRVSGKVTLDLPGLAEPADGTIHSIPEDRPQQLNLLFIRRGRMPELGTHNEVVVGEAFAEAHGFQPGNEIDATIYGARQRLKIVGIALSPEYVFEARPGETLPDNRRFGVFWMNERELATAFELDGAFNSVLIDVAPGEDTSSVMAELDRVLAPYGGLVAYSRKDHASAVRLNDELRVLRGLSVAFPAVFLSIAAFMTSAVLTRLIRLQREQIAQLKAFGYSSRQGRRALCEIRDRHRGNRDAPWRCRWGASRRQCRQRLSSVLPVPCAEVLGRLANVRRGLPRQLRCGFSWRHRGSAPGRSASAS